MVIIAAPTTNASVRVSSRTSFILAPMRAPGSDAPCAREREAWLQPDQGVSGAPKGTVGAAL
jgi:hypothetical protein